MKSVDDAVAQSSVSELGTTAGAPDELKVNQTTG